MKGEKKNDLVSKNYISIALITITISWGKIMSDNSSKKGDRD